jgi:hypothetical protein
MRVDANKNYSFEHDQYLFKYIDLHKLIYFLNSANLFFSPLSYFDDPLEGISEKVLFDKHQAENNQDSNLNQERRNNKVLQDDEKKEHYRNYLQRVQRRLFASCWFLGIRESLAMWESYSNNDSVALRFNPSVLCTRMIERFEQIDEKDFTTMAHGKVEYFKLSPFDPNDVGLKKAGHRFSGFIKDLSYKHEEEFRFLLMQAGTDNQYQFYEFSPGSLDELDFNIIAHPYMEDWKFKNIFNILKMKRIEGKLVKSEIPTRRQIFENY